jgi:transposase
MDIKTHLLINPRNNNGLRMLPNEKDKENLVIDLLKKGHKTREIAKMAHVSNTTIKKIRQKLTTEAKGEQEQQGDQRKKPLSISSQAFNLFQEGKSVVQVTTGLDLTTDQALKIHSDYLTLQNRQDVVSMLIENENKPTELLELLHYLRESHLILKDVKEIVDIKKNIKNYNSEMDKLDLDTFHAKEFLKYYNQEIDKMKYKYYDLKNRNIL